MYIYFFLINLNPKNWRVPKCHPQDLQNRAINKMNYLTLRVCLFILRTRDPSSIMKKEHALLGQRFDFMHTPKNQRKKRAMKVTKRVAVLTLGILPHPQDCHADSVARPSTWCGYRCPYVYVSTNGSGNGQDNFLGAFLSAARHMIGSNNATDSIITHFHSKYLWEN